MLKVMRFEPSARIKLTGRPLSLSRSLEAEVERLWTIEQSRRSEPLFNGRILSALEVGPELIVGAIAEYRHLIAQRAKPELFDELNLRPVAVSGLSDCEGAILFGRRAKSVSEAPGLWELCPSGGMGVQDAVAGSYVDYRAQILIELKEEIGVSAGAVAKVSPFCIVEDPKTHVVDVGIALSITASPSEIISMHRNFATQEYEELSVVPRKNLLGFIAGKSGGIAEVSATLIKFARIT